MRDAMKSGAVCSWLFMACLGAVAGGEYPCHRIAVPPQIDGRLDEAGWQALPEQGGFRIAASERYVAVRQSRFRMGWDEKHLFIGIELDEPDIAKVGSGGAGPTFFQDSVEIFLMPKAPIYYRIAVSASGKLEGPTRFEETMYTGRDVPNSGCEAAAARGDKAWSVEIKIPFAVFGGRPAANAAWRANLCRVSRIATGTGEELTTWAVLPRAHFHDYSQFASIRFLDKALSPTEAAAASKALNADFAAARQKAPPDASRKQEILARAANAENLSTRKGVHAYPAHFGTEHILRKESPPGDEQNVWHFPGGRLPIAAIVAWPEPITCNTLVIRWGSSKEPAEHYGIEWWDGKGYQLLFETKGNADGVSIHTFEPVTTSRLRLTLFTMPVRYYCTLVRQFQVYDLTAKEAQR